MTKGLEYKKADLHVHTPASHCFGEKNITPEQFVKTVIDNGLDLIAVTDHNSGDWIDGIKKAADGTALTIIPGVEISLKEGFHLIAFQES